MAYWICKVGRDRGQFRITLPKKLVKEMGWQDVKHVVMHNNLPPVVCVEEWKRGKDLENEGSGNKAGSHR